VGNGNGNGIVSLLELDPEPGTVVGREVLETVSELGLVAEMPEPVPGPLSDSLLSVADRELVNGRLVAPDTDAESVVDGEAAVETPLVLPDSPVE
jgi:hypothetical protein